MTKKGSKLKKLAMRWRYRLDNARAIFGLLTFAVLLGATYAKRIPWFMEQGFWRGDFLLSLLILLVFVIGGYLYDRAFELWSEDITVRVERNPYTYVPGPKEFLITIAVQHLLAYLLFKEDEKEAKLFLEILSEYFSLTPNSEDYREKSNNIKTLSIDFVKKIKEKMKTEEEEG